METVLERTTVTKVRPTKADTVFQRLKNLLPDAYWPWVLLVISVGLVAWQTTLLGEVVSYIHGYLAATFEDVTIGWNKAGKDSPTARLNPLTPYSFVSIVMGLVVLAVTFAFLMFFSWLHHRFLYQRLLLKPGLGYTALYVLWLAVFWRFLVYFGNSFDPGFTTESVTFATFITGFSVVYAFVQNYRQNQRQQLALIQQRTQAELDALKAQVNPHFLFNSLNNIYGTAIGEGSPRTAESIQQLSGIVRYVMEESRLQTTDIRRELRFIDDFVELQRIRLPNQDNIEIKTDIEWDEKPAQIVPLLLNPLIENAFKYGISMQFPCFVRIRLRVQDGTLHLTTENSILPRTDLEKGTGLGLTNVRQRLALAYPDRHELVANERNDAFLVDLTIKL